MISLPPIVERELRVAARRSGVYRIRYLTGLLAGAATFCCLVWADSIFGISLEPGKGLFVILELLALIFCLYAGLFFTVDALSRENREGTLGLLFLTRLRGCDIILGKFAAHALRSGSAFLTFIPALAISFCLGGVSGGLFWSAVLALGNLLFFSLALGLLVSTISRSDGQSFCLLLLAIFLPSALGIGEMMWSHSSSVEPLFLVFNPLYPCLLALDVDQMLAVNVPMISPLFQVSSLLAVHFTGWLALALASFILPHRVKTTPIRAQKPPAISPHSCPRRTPAKRARFRFFPGGIGTAALWLFCLASGWLWFGNKPLWAKYAIPEITYPLLVCFLLKLYVAWHSCDLMMKERGRGGLEILLTSPISVAEILRQKRRALLRQFAAPVIYALAVQAVFVLDEAGNAGALNFRCAFMLGAMAILILDGFALAWIGLWRGLVAANVSLAFGQTLLFGLVLPWIPFGVFFSLLWFILGPDFSPEPGWLLSLGMAFSAVIGLGVGFWALAQTHDKFRLVAGAAPGKFSLRKPRT